MRPSDRNAIAAHPFDLLRERMIGTIERASASDLAERDWYPRRAYSECADIASEFGYNIRTIAGIMATFSATCGWAQNIIATRKFVAHYRATGERLGVVRSGDAIRKAEAILNGANPAVTIVKRDLDYRQAWKTLSFYRNILGSRWSITVDVWIFRLLTDDPKTQVRPDGAFYLYLADCIRRVAREYGYSGPEFQAILWTVIRGSGS